MAKVGKPPCPICKGIHDSLGFWIPQCGLWIPGTKACGSTDPLIPQANI